MRTLGRNQDHRNHLIRNLATSLVLYEKIETTEAKAKEVKPFLEKLLYRAKPNDLTAIRLLNGVLFDKNAVKKVREVLVKRYANRQSGFIRSFRLKNRLGDNSKMMRLELVDMLKFDAPDTMTEASSVEKVESEESAVKVKTLVKKKKNDGK